MIFVVYMIFRISVGYAKKVLRIIPVVLPPFDAGGALLPPLVFECHQVFQSLILGDSGIDLLQIRHQRLDVFIADKAGGGTDLMDDAPLHLAAGIDCPNGFHEAFQTVHTEQINIPPTSLLLRSFSTFSQNLLLSCSPIQTPRMSFVPSMVMPKTTYAALVWY